MNKKGFTLVELIATIIILGVISMIAVPSYNRYIEKTKQSKCDADERAILDAAEAFVGDCIVKNKCATGSQLSAYLDATPVLKVEYLTNKSFLSSDYSKYNAVKIKITSTVIDGITDYSFQLHNKPTDFDTKCK